MLKPIIEFQQLLDNYLHRPEEADLDRFWQIFTETIDILELEDGLILAGETFTKIAEIVKERSFLILEEIDAESLETGVVLPADFFDEFVRQSQSIDFSEFIIPSPEPLPRNREINTSIAAVVDKQTLLKSLEVEAETWQVSHSENIPAWREAISLYLRIVDRSISLPELQKGLKMPLTEVWMGLLLGGEEYWTIEQQGEFYDNNSIIIKKN